MPRRPATPHSEASRRDPAVRLPRTHVVCGRKIDWVTNHATEPGSGIRLRPLLGANAGARHLGVSIVELAPGAQIRGHMHPFEESFFVLDGHLLVNLDGRAYELVAGDFGLAPIAAAHACRNASDRPVRYLRVYAPHPRPVGPGSSWGVFAADAGPPTRGCRIEPLDPQQRYVGHFDAGMLPAPASILMPGYHGPNIKDVSVAMLVDPLVGSQHHTLFVVEFAPSGGRAPSAAQHWHPFEEIYYFLSGEATVFCEDEEILVTAGDLVFAAAGTAHGFSARENQPVRWIEAQSPLPPPSNGFVFRHDWQRLESLG
jgi:quercetin dioxygenase-like cupin family protein